MTSQWDTQLYDAGNRLDAVDTFIHNHRTVKMVFVNGDEPTHIEIREAFGGMVDDISTYEFVGVDDDDNELIGVTITIA